MGTKIGKGMKDGNSNLGGCRIKKKRDGTESARAYYFSDKILLLYINVLGVYRQRR